jgi:hemerythrin-like domain-containing protein
MNLPSPAPIAHPPTGTPLDQFSKCHVGIVQQLVEMDKLPALLEAAAQARRIAGDLVRFYKDVVREHHLEEERELFPAVLASATPGSERDVIHAIIVRLTREHREVEAAFERMLPELKAAAKGHEAHLEVRLVESLVAAYWAHAAYEEESFLPMSQQILGRNGDHMAALGVSLHMRHALPAILARVGHRI